MGNTVTDCVIGSSRFEAKGRESGRWGTEGIPTARRRPLGGNRKGGGAVPRGGGGGGGRGLVVGGHRRGSPIAPHDLMGGLPVLGDGPWAGAGWVAGTTRYQAAQGRCQEVGEGRIHIEMKPPSGPSAASDRPLTESYQCPPPTGPPAPPPASPSSSRAGEALRRVSRAGVRA